MKKKRNKQLMALVVVIAILASGCRLKAGSMYNVYNTGLNGVDVAIFAVPTNQIGTLHLMNNGDYNKTADWLLDNVPMEKGTFEFTDPFNGIDGIAEWRYGLSDGNQRAHLGTVIGWLINLFDIMRNWNEGRTCLVINKWLTFPAGWHQQWTTTQDQYSHHCPPGQNMAL